MKEKGRKTINETLAVGFLLLVLGVAGFYAYRSVIETRLAKTYEGQIVQLEEQCGLNYAPQDNYRGCLESARDEKNATMMHIVSMIKESAETEQEKAAVDVWVRNYRAELDMCGSIAKRELENDPKARLSAREERIAVLMCEILYIDKRLKPYLDAIADK